MWDEAHMAVDATALACVFSCKWMHRWVHLFAAGPQRLTELPAHAACLSPAKIVFSPARAPRCASSPPASTPGTGPLFSSPISTPAWRGRSSDWRCVDLARGRGKGVGGEAGLSSLPSTDTRTCSSLYSPSLTTLSLSLRVGADVHLHLPSAMVLRLAG